MNSSGFFEQKRGLIAVWGNEAVQFLDGLITNDMKTLGDGEQILAAFPNAQGRLLAVVRVKRVGDRFFFETEEATREKVFQNLFRFTYAGDFFVEDLSESKAFFEVFGPRQEIADSLVYELSHGAAYFVPTGAADEVRAFLAGDGYIPIDDELYETLRIESGIPKYGVDMDENTIVPELGLDGLISYNKGCYIGQEIIARIHFRGHVAKRLTGLILSEPSAVAVGLMSETDLSTLDGKNAGRITSHIYSPKLEKHIALAFVRYDHLAAGTELMCGDVRCTVAELPFI